MIRSPRVTIPREFAAQPARRRRVSGGGIPYLPGSLRVIAAIVGPRCIPIRLPPTLARFAARTVRGQRATVETYLADSHPVPLPRHFKMPGDISASQHFNEKFGRAHLDCL